MLVQSAVLHGCSAVQRPVWGLICALAPYCKTPESTEPIAGEEWMALAKCRCSVSLSTLARLPFSSFEMHDAHPSDVFSKRGDGEGNHTFVGRLFPTHESKVITAA